VTVETAAPSATRQPVDLVERARALGPLIRAHADETERAGTLAGPVVEALREAELFWCLVPTEMGGLGADLASVFDLLEEVSRHDGSTGWSLMANCLITGCAAVFLGDDAVEELFGGGRRTIGAGMLGPGGTGTVVDGGLRGSGHYSFASGAGHADWLGGGMFVVDGDDKRLLPSGMPQCRVVVLTRDRVEFTGNWDVIGLQGTGSFDFEIPDQVIDEGWTFERTNLVPRRGGARYEVGVAGLGCLGHAAVATGIARRALEEISVIAESKQRPAHPCVVTDNPVFRHGFAMQEAAFQSARMFARDAFAEADAVVASGQPLQPMHRQRFRHGVIYAHEVYPDVVRFAHEWAGQSALRHPSPLGRCTLDMAVATQHAFVDPVHLVDVAGTLLDAWRADAAR
jgi:alkylation response protein AidB-like acyl-CoA dehydrogenase